ncbi:transglutaminase-like cysteine peptidase [Pseudorhizobium sp. NPDC055634]
MPIRYAFSLLFVVLSLFVSAVSVAADSPPAGYQIHCLKYRCPSGGAPWVRLTPSRDAELGFVNRSVNRTIRYVPDVKDEWRLGVTTGDCEEYALAKQHALIARGWPPAALRLAVVLTRGGASHTVLVVKTDAGDLVLDNRRSVILPLQKTGYKLVKMATENPRIWWSPKDAVSGADHAPAAWS